MLEDIDLQEIIGSIFTGITVGVGSQVMLFDGGSIILQCEYECEVNGDFYKGDGEKIETSVCLFPFLNRRLLSATFNEDYSLTLSFSESLCIKIIPDKSELESYVLNTRNGIIPIHGI